MMVIYYDIVQIDNIYTGLSILNAELNYIKWLQAPSFRCCYHKVCNEHITASARTDINLARLKAASDPNSSNFFHCAPFESIYWTQSHGWRDQDGHSPATMPEFATRTCVLASETTQGPLWVFPQKSASRQQRNAMRNEGFLRLPLSSVSLLGHSTSPSTFHFRISLSFPMSSGPLLTSLPIPASSCPSMTSPPLPFQPRQSPSISTASDYLSPPLAPAPILALHPRHIFIT